MKAPPLVAPASSRHILQCTAGILLQSQSVHFTSSGYTLYTLCNSFSGQQMPGGDGYSSNLSGSKPAWNPQRSFSDGFHEVRSIVPHGLHSSFIYPFRGPRQQVYLVIPSVSTYLVSKLLVGNFSATRNRYCCGCNIPSLPPALFLPLTLCPPGNSPSEHCLFDGVSRPGPEA